MITALTPQHQGFRSDLVLLWKTVWQFLKELDIELPCDPAIPLPGVYLGGEDIFIQRLVHDCYSVNHNSQRVEAV